MMGASAAVAARVAGMLVSIDRSFWDEGVTAFTTTHGYLHLNRRHRQDLFVGGSAVL
jgi:hypothetical protein